MIGTLGGSTRRNTQARLNEEGGTGRIFHSSQFTKDI